MSAPPPPPPPAFNLASATSTSPDQGRNLLLQSIRGGKTLRKTVTNDKSAPCISGTVKNGSINSNNSLSSPPSPRNANNTNTNSSGPMSLGGLFAGGMPKLKPTGLRGLKTVDKDSSCPSSPSTLNLSPNNFNNNNNNSNSNNNNNNNSNNNNNNNSATIKRGPPPVPPPAAQKPQVPSQNINELNSQEPITKGFGKPMLAPKPPAPLSPGSQQQKPCPPPKKLDLIRGGSVSRAQSMRVPRSPPVLAPSPASIHQSQDCLNETQHRPINRILKPPVVRPPSPPISRPVVVAAATTSPSITRSAPPPPTTTRIAAAPPTMPPPPPPPPHRSSIGHQRLAPPPPPTRNLSLSNEQQTTINLEQRFIDLFHSIATFPNPEPFRGVPKLYSSKNAAKQQAPAPPQQSSTSSGSMIQLNTSSGVKQWQHNAASSTC